VRAGRNAVGDIHRDDDNGTTQHDETAGFDPPVDLEPGTDDATVDEPPAHPAAAEATSLDESTDLKPGDVPATLVAAIWTEDSAQDLRGRWREAQLRFVEDPRKVAEDTRDLLNEAVEALTAALSSHREQLNDWPTNRDTEQYRMLVQRYRTL
jgi:hypothetical protein